MSFHYILDAEHNVVPCDLLTWANWIEDSDARTVALDEIGPYRVSTVFMGLDLMSLDHNWMLALNARKVPNYQPVVFETMAWKQLKPETSLQQVLDEETREWLDIQERCRTWEEALRQHASVMRTVQALWRTNQ